MTIALRLLGEVSYDGAPIAGARSPDLLAALALHRPGLSDARLVDEVWGDDPPAVPAKALQVLVSRLRTQLGAGALARADGGYRLALPPAAVDAWVLESLVGDAAQALAAGRAPRALALADGAADLVAAVGDDGGEGPLGRLRREARERAATVARLRGLALSRSGEDAAAVEALREVQADDPDDAEALAALLRSEAATSGAPAALARYETYRADLADRLGVDPDPALQRLHRELLAADEPVRSGVRYEADELLGRDTDLSALRALVRTGRLTTILGPGGLGKTRTAHVLAREATQPRVHFVELVGISAAEDVVSEVGSALGVRNSVTGRRTLTPAQLADVRGRIAQELDSVPTLLVLDNCEHVLDATASLVAYLLATTRDLHVVTTSRAPLGIAAERVFVLSQLAAADGAELFRRRALAVRPGADLPDDAVADVVARLDGLPLAVELAAARVRTMSVEEVRRALAESFGVLRSRDRTAPARHQTLTAVIAWSWNLLAEPEQRALAWLSVFQDGFTARTATHLLGPDGADLVEALVDQSLLTVVEHAGGVRYRMLETVREYAGQRLGEAGQTEAAREAQTAWAVDLARSVRPDVFGVDQVAAIDVLAADETNLADVLRRCLLAEDVPRAVSLLAVLGALWSVTGNFGRFLAMSDLGERILLDWTPPPELEQQTVDAVSMLLVHLGFLRPDGVAELSAYLARLPEPTAPWTRIARSMFVDAEAAADRLTAVLALTDDPDPRTRGMAWMWASVLAENEGAIDDSEVYLEKALGLVDDRTTAWEVATLHTQRAVHALNRGHHEDAARHAEVAIPLLERLHADDDAFSMRTSVALSAMRLGRVEEAERLIEEAGEPPYTDVTGGLVRRQVDAELRLRRGDVEGALRGLDESLAAMRQVSFAGLATNGLEPWNLIPLASALAGHVAYAATEARRARTRELAHQTVDRLAHLAEVSEGAIDYPVTGMGLAALATWLLTQREGESEVEAGVRLLALADGFSYNRWFEVLDWERLRSLADDAAPGRLAAVLEEYDGRRGRELRGETERVLASLAVTSSG